MKRIIYIIAINTIGLCSTFSQNIDSFKWLEGSWKIETGTDTNLETWKIKNDSTLSAQSIFVYGKDTVPQEKIELKYRNENWYYHPVLDGQDETNSVQFKVILVKGTEFISENPDHDFPQRISYRRIKDQIFASIEGKNDGKYMKQNFDFKRN